MNYLAKIALMLVFALVPGLAGAANECGVSSDNGLWTHPAFSMSDAGSVGEPVTEWRSLSQHIDFGCSAGISVEAGAHGNVASVGSYVESGVTYTVVGTGISGLGAVFRLRSQASGQSAGSVVPFVRSAHNASYRGVANTMYATAWVRFIRMGAVAAGVHTTSGTISPGLSYVKYGSTSYWYKSRTISAFQVTVNPPAPSCTVSQKAVDMGIIHSAEIGQSGAAGPIKPFTVQLSCNASAGMVDFKAIPTTALISAEQGRMAVEGGASGIGIQVLNADDSPLALNVVQYFGLASELVVSRDFKARYVRTSGPLVMGQANAGLTLELTYP